MHEEMDGKQDVRLFLRSIQYVVGCIFGDEAFADCMVFTFHPWPASIEHAPDYKGDILRYGSEQLHVLKDHRNEKGQAPLCYVDTGYRGSPLPTVANTKPTWSTTERIWYGRAACNYIYDNFRPEPSKVARHARILASQADA